MLPKKNDEKIRNGWKCWNKFYDSLAMSILVNILNESHVHKHEHIQNVYKITKFAEKKYFV